MTGKKDNEINAKLLLTDYSDDFLGKPPPDLGGNVVDRTCIGFKVVTAERVIRSLRLLWTDSGKTV